MPKKPTAGKRADPHYQAQAILSRRDHSEAEMRQKLQRKGFSAEHITETVAWLKEKRLVDDVAFARRYMEYLLATKAVGPRWITAKLVQKKINPETVQDVLASSGIIEQEAVLVQRAAEAWQRAHARQRDDFVRLGRFLLSRGFSPHAVSQYVDELRRLS